MLSLKSLIKYLNKYFIQNQPTGVKQGWFTKMHEKDTLLKGHDLKTEAKKKGRKTKPKAGIFFSEPE